MGRDSTFVNYGLTCHYTFTNIYVQQQVLMLVVTMVVFMLMVSYAGETLELRTVPANNPNVHLDTRLVAKHFGLDRKRVVFTSKVGEVRKIKNSRDIFHIPINSIDVSVEGCVPLHLEVYEDDTSLWESETDGTDSDGLDVGDTDEDRFRGYAHMKFDDPQMQARYDFLRYKRMPTNISRFEQEACKSFRRECRRSYDMDTHGNLLFLGNQRRPTRPT